MKLKCLHVNHIPEKIIVDAHHTSAKYPKNLSEFDQTKLKSEYKKILPPYVKGSPVQLDVNLLMNII